jgi:hypothetical protein
MQMQLQNTHLSQVEANLLSFPRMNSLLYLRGRRASNYFIDTQATTSPSLIWTKNISRPIWHLERPLANTT